MDVLLPTLPNPWLLYLNLKYQAMDEAYKRKLVLYAGINTNGSNQNNHLYDTNSMGMAEDGVQHLGTLNPLGDRYGYLNDGPVPTTGQLMDMKHSFDDLVNAQSTKVVTMYSDWVETGRSNGSSTVKTYLPSSPKYEGDGFATHILFMDYHHDRMVNGGYYDDSSNLLDDIGLGFIGFDTLSERKHYIISSLGLDGKWDIPTDSLLNYNVLQGPWLGSINNLRLEPLYLSIAHNIAPGMISSSLCAFSDVELGASYTNSVNELCKLGVIRGNPDGTFGINDPISRAEFLKMAMLAADSSKKDSDFPQTKTSFSDVPISHWASGYIDSAHKSKSGIVIVAGIQKSGKLVFEPENVVNRATAAKITSITFFGSLNLVKLYRSDFTDVKDSEWYYPYVSTLAEKSIVKGSLSPSVPSKYIFRPSDQMSRGEAATVVCRAYSYKKQSNTALCD